MFSFNREHEAPAFRVSGSALEEDLSLLRRRTIQVGKCYCLLALATLAWLAFTQTLDQHPNMLESISFTRFNLDYPSLHVQDIWGRFQPVVDESHIPPLTLSTSSSYESSFDGIHKPVEHLTLSRIVGRKFRLHDRKPLRTSRPTPSS
ncbi:hypothetical protein VP01_2545g1 [Puccinia sorghi]|uniref:Uncharacterized protein n=1 Tax=Puccinia sorghi TaxID=27349 RepID=A0A0L6V728_9BASI|nr:hypothetical protein VP01_2545g1 [Puccinia sorghi]